MCEMSFLQQVNTVDFKDKLDSILSKQILNHMLQIPDTSNEYKMSKILYSLVTLKEEGILTSQQLSFFITPKRVTEYTILINKILGETNE